MAAYTQVSSQALNCATRLNHVVDPLGRVKGVPANWNYIVVRSEVKTPGGKISLWPLSLSLRGRVARRNSTVKRQDAFRDETWVQRESIEVSLSSASHRFPKAFLYLDKYFGHLGASVRVQQFLKNISISQGQIAPPKYL